MSEAGTFRGHGFALSGFHSGSSQQTSALIAQLLQLPISHPSRKLTRCPGTRRAQPDTCWLVALVTDKMCGPETSVLVDRNLVYHSITSHHNRVTLACPFSSPKTSPLHFHPKKRSRAEGHSVYETSVKPDSVVDVIHCMALSV